MPPKPSTGLSKLYSGKLQRAIHLHVYNKAHEKRELKIQKNKSEIADAFFGSNNVK